MKYLLALGVGLVVAVAWAGSRAAESGGGVPTDAGQGVSLSGVTACRASVRQTDGGTINGGKVGFMYYDAVNGWVASPSVFDCSLSTAGLPDGGIQSAQVCPDMTVGVEVGRIGAFNKAIINGSGAPTLPIVRVECWGPNF